MNNGTVILDEVLSESRVETLNVGPTNVSVRFIVNQSPPDYRDIGVGVSVLQRDSFLGCIDSNFTYLVSCGKISLLAAFCF